MFNVNSILARTDEIFAHPEGPATWLYMAVVSSQLNVWQALCDRYADIAARLWSRAVGGGNSMIACVLSSAIDTSADVATPLGYSSYQQYMDLNKVLVRPDRNWLLETTDAK